MQVSPKAKRLAFWIVAVLDCVLPLLALVVFMSIMLDATT